MDYFSPLFVGGLTTGQIAGLIAAGIFVAQILLSLLWPLVLVGLVKETETAVTWSVVARIIYNSWWPTVARTDATASKGVRTRVNIISWFITLSSILVAISAIATPLGLHEGVTADKEPTSVPFRYVKDTSALGVGTPSRPDLGFSRICRLGFAACPNSNNNVTHGEYENGTMYGTAYGGYDTRITKNLFDFLSAGAPRIAPTVSSVFDIQWRTYTDANAQNASNSIYDVSPNYYNNGSTYVIGTYRPVASLILDEAWEVVEGLIVDLKSGGVGFRNHSIPFTESPYGGTWSEDILFIEPVTECVDLNVSVDYTLGSSVGGSMAVRNPAIIDHGGFFAANKTSPSYNPSDDQIDPQLAYRAYQGAWLTNAMTMVLFNITNLGSELWKLPFSYLNSHFGAQYKLPSSNDTGEAATFLLSHNAINTGDFYGWLSEALEDGRSISFSYANVPRNPFQMNSSSYFDIVRLCSGTYFTDQAPHREVVGGACGLLFGIPRRKDNSSSVLLQEGTQWTTPIYSCASASRALIKTVNFGFNKSTDASQSQSLEGLSVLDVKPKSYSSSSEYPLWAAEYGDQPEWSIASLKPIWGLVVDEDPRFKNLAYRRAPHLWLTGDGVLTQQLFNSDQNLPAVDFPEGALSCSYDVKGSSISGCSDTVGDYSGAQNLKLYNLWKNLSSTAKDSARIVNLIWTDMAANAVVGTKGWIPSPAQTDLAPSPPQSSPEKRADVPNSSSDNVSSEEAMVPITLFNRTAKYHIFYAIPGFLVLGIVLFALMVGLLLMCFRRVSLGRMKRHLIWLSSGRIMTALLDEDETGVREISSGKQMNVSTTRWLKQRGRMLINLSTGVPRTECQSLNDRNDEAGKAMLVVEETTKAETS